MNQTTKKKATNKLRYFITAATLFALLFCFTGCSKKTPQEALQEAYTKTFVENNPMEQVLGLSELNTKLTENQAHSKGFSYTIRELSDADLGDYAGYLTGLGISVDSASDVLNRKSTGTMDITYGGATYLSLGGQIQGSEIFLTCPQLLDSSLSVNLSTLEEDLSSDSAIAELLKESEITLPENFSADIHKVFSSTEALEDINKLVTAYEVLNDALVVEKLEKKEISLPSNVTAKSVYNVTVPKQAYVTFINEILDYADETSSSLSKSLESEEMNSEELDLTSTKEKVQKLADTVGDIVVTVAVTKEGYINYFTWKIATEGDSALFTASFTGETTPLEAWEVLFDATIDETTYHFSFAQEFDTIDNELTMTANASENNKMMFSFECVGTFNDIEKGKKYALDFDYIELEVGDVLSVSLSGDCYIDTTKCDIAAPGKSEYNLLRMSKDDFSLLLQEVIVNLKEDPKLSKIVGYLMGYNYE